MLRGFYLASNSLINQQRVIDNISNNVANSQTAGFKSESNVQNTFHRQLILLNGGRVNTTGTFEYKYTEKSQASLTQGTFEFTESPLDIAINGPMYFNIQTEDGDRLLTRNGQFSIDDEGYLALGSDGRIMGENGEILINSSDFSISNNGEIFIDGQLVDRLELTYIEPNSDIQKAGNNTFEQIDGENGEIPEELEYSVIQGAYERSNVDMATEMTKAIAAQRQFEAVSQALQMIDTINQKAVTELAKF